MRRHRLETLFIIQVYLGSKFRPSVLEIVGVRYIRDFASSMSAPHVKIVPLLGVHELLIFFAGTLT
jgi:hypothetical protein